VGWAWASACAEHGAVACTWPLSECDLAENHWCNLVVTAVVTGSSSQIASIKHVLRHVNILVLKPEPLSNLSDCMYVYVYMFVLILGIAHPYTKVQNNHPGLCGITVVGLLTCWQEPKIWWTKCNWMNNRFF